MKVVELPYRPASGSWEGMPSAVGDYVNLLRVGRLLIVPAYGLPEDEVAQEILGRLFLDCSVVRLSCCRVASEGGVLNCISWCVRAEGVGMGQLRSVTSTQQAGEDHPPRPETGDDFINILLSGDVATGMGRPISIPLDRGRTFLDSRPRFHSWVSLTTLPTRA